MHWESASAFFAMGGHGFWVWMAWGVAVLAIVLELISLRRGRRSALVEIRRIARLEDEQAGVELRPRE